MKINSPQEFFGTAALEGKRIPNSSSATTFSTALHKATLAHTQAKTVQASLPLLPNQSSTATSSREAKPQHGLNERALSLRAYRQELIASNIANADTPGYKAVDFDINHALQAGMTKENVQLQYRIPAQDSIDGNTVEMDVERAEFARNALMYEFSVDRVKGYYKMMEELLKGTP
jgi:flagellar basal body rod protein FlgB